MSDDIALIMMLVWFICGFLVGASWAMRKCINDLVEMKRQPMNLRDALTILQMKRNEEK